MPRVCSGTSGGLVPIMHVPINFGHRSTLGTGSRLNSPASRHFSPAISVTSQMTSKSIMSQCPRTHPSPSPVRAARVRVMAKEEKKIRMVERVKDDCLNLNDEFISG